MYCNICTPPSRIIPQYETVHGSAPSALRTSESGQTVTPIRIRSLRRTNTQLSFTSHPCRDVSSAVQLQLKMSRHNLHDFMDIGLAASLRRALISQSAHEILLYCHHFLVYGPSHFIYTVSSVSTSYMC